MANIAVVNFGLEYMVSYIELSRKIKISNVFYTAYSSVIRDIDQFLVENVSEGDKLIFLGFDDSIKKTFNMMYRHYDNTFIHGDDAGDLLNKIAGDTYADAGLNDPKFNLYKYTMDWVKCEYKFRQSYYLNILFRKFKNVRFVEEFSNGIVDFEPYMRLIKMHVIEAFNDKKISIINHGKTKVAVAMDRVEYLDDYLYKGFKNNKYTVVILVDVDRGKVFFRKRNDEKFDILKICKKVCDGDGKEFACSGKLDDKCIKFLCKFGGNNG